MAQFNYCPLIWMYHNRTYHFKINRLHKRCLELINSDKGSFFEDLLENDNYVSLNHKDLGALAIHTETSPEIIPEVFLVKKQGNYNLRNQIYFLTPQVKSINYDLERIQILRPKI